jgi:hypothetical protein
VNPLLLLALAAGTLAGVAAAVLVAAVSPDHPRLADALAALDERTPHLPEPETGSWVARLLVPLIRWLPGAVPTSDLELLGWTRDRFLIGRIGAALAYFAAGPVLAATLAVLDAGLSFTLPAAFGVVGAVVGWSGFGRLVADRAERARDELRFALVSYLQQVSLLRQGGAGVATALTVPGRLLADSWAMRRLRDELDLAERTGEMPWEGLRRFGEQIDLPELADLSSIAATAGNDGGAVVGTLQARAESLRDELLADEHAAANRASSQMSTPGALQVFLIAAWVLFPAGTALLSNT